MKPNLLLFPVISAGLLLSVISCGKSSRLDFTVSNPSDFTRHELAAIPLADITVGAPFKLIDNYGSEIPYQLTSDSLVVFDAELAPGAATAYAIVPGEPGLTADTIACGAF